MRSLEDLVKAKTPLTLHTVWRYAVGMARGLEALHSGDVGIIHADLELRNVFIDDKDEIIIGDFGAALVIDEASGMPDVGVMRARTRLTRASSAPEARMVLQEAALHVHTDVFKLLQESVHESVVTTSADIWAWGYCLLCLLEEKEELPCDALDDLARLSGKVRGAASIETSGAGLASL